MRQTSIIAKGITVKQQNNLLLDNISFALNEGEHLLITGTSGSGKTTLAKVFAGNLFHKGIVDFCDTKPEIIFVEQHYFFKTLSNTNDFYYQQRYNSCESNDARTVSEELLSIATDESKIDVLLHQLNLMHRKHESLLHLSSGEHKRFQLVKAFLQQADVFILDSPFVGLDVNSRKILCSIIDEKAKASTIIVIADVEDAPSCITRVAALEDGKLKQFESIEVYKKNHSPFTIHYSSLTTHHSLFNGTIPLQKHAVEFDVAVRLENVSVAYGEKKILSNVNWQINRGERWLLKGVNGSGKSTLISLITGDHPQAYANKVFLFDRKRGSGESIWDIKKKIGFVSPELHWYYDKTISVYNTIASGFFDTIGVYKKLSQEQQNAVEEWLQFLNIKSKAQQQLHTISTSQQRLALLARALVKNPPLLILDEPCQGLDEQQVNDFVVLVDDLCGRSNTTLIYVSHYESEIPKCVCQNLDLSDYKINRKSLKSEHKGITSLSSEVETLYQS